MASRDSLPRQARNRASPAQPLGCLWTGFGEGRAEVAESPGLGPEQGQVRARARAKSANSSESPK